MTKLEKVALKYARKNGRPLVMAFTSELRCWPLLMPDIHLFPNTEEGHAVLRQLQQRAEQWAARVSGIVADVADDQGMMTMVFTTDDFCELPAPVA